MPSFPANLALEELRKNEVELTVRNKLESIQSTAQLVETCAPTPAPVPPVDVKATLEEYRPTQDPPYRLYDEALRSGSITIDKYRRASPMVKEKMAKHIELIIYKTERADYVAWTVTFRKNIPVMSKVWVENVIGKSPFYQREAIKLRKYLADLSGDHYPMNYMLYKYNKDLLEAYPMDPYNLFMKGKRCYAEHIE